MTSVPPAPSSANGQPESLIVYPCAFPIKVMGQRLDGFVHALTQIAHQFDPEFDASKIELRESKGGKYLGVTLTINATSRAQLDDIYRALSTHPMVKMVL
jgi:putative lipoic acid-binding regulatory protein